MTKDEWLTVEVGDVVIETSSGARRPVLSVKRISGKRGQRGKTRTRVTVQSIKSPDRIVLLASTEDVRGKRWLLEKAGVRGSVERMPDDADTVSEQSPEVMTVLNIRRCARCAADHDEVKAKKLTIPFAPPEAHGQVWTHWALCPTNGEPIMIATV